MGKVSLDLRMLLELVIYIDEGVAYQPSINDIENIDTGYTLTFPNITYTVGNGLILSANSVTLNIEENDFPQGSHVGILISDSRQAGIYFKMKINVISYANS